MTSTKKMIMKQYHESSLLNIMECGQEIVLFRRKPSSFMNILFYGRNILCKTLVDINTFNNYYSEKVVSSLK
jgi:hypothetical protein